VSSTTGDLNHALQSHGLAILGDAEVFRPSRTRIVLQLFHQAAIRVGSPHKEASCLGDSTRVKVATANLPNRMLCKGLDVFWVSSIDEVAEAELPAHVQPPSKQESILSSRHRVLPSACDLIDHYLL
jgi:hypothetical protein